MSGGPWPSGGGEMARRIREHDWATSLGPTKRWPQSLKTAVDVVLAMPDPATLLWGRAYVQIYNDSYVDIARDRHPGLLGRPAAEGWSEVYSEVMKPILDAARAGRSTKLAGHSASLYAPNGRLEERVFDTTFSPVRDESGAIAGVLQTLVETTGRKRTEAKAREGQERYRQLVELLPVAVYTISAPEGRITYFNDKAAALWGRRPNLGDPEERLCGSFRLWHPDGRPLPQDQTPMAAALAEGRSFRNLEVVIERSPPDSSRAVVVVNIAPLRGPDGRVVGAVNVFFDKTAQAEAEQALRESEEKLRLAADAAGLGRWELLPKTGELAGDEAFARLHAASSPQLDLEDHLDAIHPDDRGGVRREVARVLAGDAGYEAEYRVPAVDGSTRWLLSRGQLLGASSGPDRLVGVTLDITAHRDLEKERERALARDLAALAEAAERERISRELHDRVAHHMGVAHQSLELYAALAQTAPERAAERLDLARETTKRALDQTRAISAELKRLQDEELEDGLEAAFRSLAGTAVPNGVSLDVAVSGEGSKIPNAVALQVYLAMREAVKNAVRHSGCSRIRVTLDVGETDVQGCVEDDGSGFDPAAVNSATPSWGVGLGSMKDRAEMLGGDARIDSRPGTGTTVELRVPLKARQESSP